MENKCIDCKHTRVKERDYYNADNVQQTEVEYICAMTGKEVNIMCNRSCKYYLKKYVDKL